MKEEKDRRYFDTKTMYERGYIRNFEDLFKYIPKTVVSLDLGIKGNIFSQMIADPKRFSIHHLEKMEELYGIPFLTLVKFAREKK